MKVLSATLKAATLAIGVAACFAAQASTTIVFDPSGTAGPTGNITISSLDQAPGNALAVGVNASSNNTAFTLYYQANLQAAQLNSSQVFSNGDGGRFFTFVAGFGETITSNTVTGPNTNILSFGFDASNPNNFYRMYAQTSAGNDLTGQGFGGTAPILTGHFVATNYSSFFGVAGGGAGTALDQSANGNQYAGVSTVTGTGATQITLVIDSFNANYFPSMVVGATSSIINTSQVLAFASIDPAAFLTTADGTQIAGATSVGAVNGRGNNTIFQADANQSFNVPEPLPTALIGVGLIGMALSRRRKQK